MLEREPFDTIQRIEFQLSGRAYRASGDRTLFLPVGVKLIRFIV